MIDNIKEAIDGKDPLLVIKTKMEGKRLTHSDLEHMGAMELSGCEIIFDGGHLFVLGSQPGTGIDDELRYFWDAPVHSLPERPESYRTVRNFAQKSGLSSAVNYLIRVCAEIEGKLSEEPVLEEAYGC